MSRLSPFGARVALRRPQAASLVKSGLWTTQTASLSARSTYRRRQFAPSYSAPAAACRASARTPLTLSPTPWRRCSRSSRYKRRTARPAPEKMRQRRNARRRRRRKRKRSATIRSAFVRQWRASPERSKRGEERTWTRPWLPASGSRRDSMPSSLATWSPPRRMKPLRRQRRAPPQAPPLLPPLRFPALAPARRRRMQSAQSWASSRRWWPASKQTALRPGGSRLCASGSRLCGARWTETRLQPQRGLLHQHQWRRRRQRRPLPRWVRASQSRRGTPSPRWSRGAARSQRRRRRDRRRSSGRRASRS
mmetsp:Transcript_1264/g.3944  ORF Transcript_1264/g.3944 Transcript_1264/m.3944 type:complete len:307 (-) Transcript_1264:130-1050(-)